LGSIQAAYSQSALETAKLWADFICKVTSPADIEKAARSRIKVGESEAIKTI
jgi:hypothetical protein